MHTALLPSRATHGKPLTTRRSILEDPSLAQTTQPMPGITKLEATHSPADSKDAILLPKWDALAHRGVLATVPGHYCNHSVGLIPVR